MVSFASVNFPSGQDLVPSLRQSLGIREQVLARGRAEAKEQRDIEDRERVIAAQDAAIQRKRDIEERLKKILPDPEDPGKQTVDQQALLRLMTTPEGRDAAKDIITSIQAGNKLKTEQQRTEAIKGARTAAFVQAQKTFAGKQAALAQIAREKSARGEDLTRIQALMNKGEPELDLALQKIKIDAQDVETLTKPVETFEDVLDAQGNVIAQRSTLTGKEIAPGRRATPTPGTAIGKARQDLARGDITQADFNTIKNAPKANQPDVIKLINSQAGIIDRFGKDSPQAEAVAAAIKSEGAGDAPKLTDIAGQRKEFTKLSGDFDQSSAAIGKLRKLATGPVSAPSDMALIFAFMKILDPPSTVREGEQATARQATGVPDQVLNLYNRAVTGETLNPKQRAQFVQSAESLFSSGVERQLRLEESFSALATSANIDPAKVVIDFLGPNRPGAVTDEGGTGVTIRFDAQGNIIQ